MCHVAELIVSSQNSTPRHVIIPATVLTIGRGESNGLVLDDQFVSGCHAEVRLQGSAYMLKDLGSTNGTLVNGKQVVERELAEGDTITIGRHTLVFRCVEGEPAESAEAAGSAQTVEENVSQIKNNMRSVGERLTLMAQSRKAPETETAALTEPNILTISKAYRRLEALYEACRLVVSELDLKKRLESILDAAIQVTGADRGFIILVNEADGRLQTEVAREMGVDATAGSPSMSIASRSALHGELMLVEDALQDAQLSSRESVILGRIRSAMSVPLRVDEKILGSVYVDSRRPEHRFTHEDLELFEAVASQSAIAIENAKLTERMIEEERRRTNLGLFLSPRVVEEVIRRQGTIELGGTKREITTLFCDIRGFTGIAERMAPADVVSMLNEYFTTMADVIFRYDGTIDKYMGDEIMAVFGAPMYAEDHALRAVKVALEMNRELRSMHERCAESSRPLFQIGIGMTTGSALAGYIGSPKRMEFTAIGDIVNVAKRLCEHAQPGQILVCAETFERVKDDVATKPLGEIFLKGKEKPVLTYEVLDVK